MCQVVSIGQRIFSRNIIGNIFQYVPVPTSTGSRARFLPTGEINKPSQPVRILLQTTTHQLHQPTVHPPNHSKTRNRNQHQNTNPVVLIWSTTSPPSPLPL